jgi:hypothetical protein
MSITKLPTQTTLGKFAFQDLVQLYYGDPGVGKTTFAARLPEANLFIATEDGQRALNAYVQRVMDWDEFLDIIRLLEKGDGEIYRSVTIDTVDNLFDFCQDAVCKRLKIQHPSDEEWGKGWDALKKEFKNAVNRLQALGMGVIFISHARSEEIKTRSVKITKWFPSYPKQCRKIINPLVDFMFYFMVEETAIKGGGVKAARFVCCQPGETWEAKDRMQCYPDRMEMNPAEFIKVFKEHQARNKTTLTKKGV